MHDQMLQFSFDMEGVDRNAQLIQAAQFIDERRGRMADDDQIVETKEGRLVRDLLKDHAELGAYPDVYKITDTEFLERDLPIPVRFAELAAKNNFYWIRFPIGLMPARNWAFHRLEVKIEFSPGDAPHLRPKAYQILPNKKFQELARGGTSLDLGIDEQFEFHAKFPPAVPKPIRPGIGPDHPKPDPKPDPDDPNQPGAPEKPQHPGRPPLKLNVDVKAAAQAGMVLGPFKYRLVKAQIDHNDTGLEWVFWRLDGAEFFAEETPDLVVIAQVPKEAKEFKVAAAMQAARYFNLAAAPIQDAVKQLPQALRAWFLGGLPMQAEPKTYDLSDFL